MSTLTKNKIAEALMERGIVGKVRSHELVNLLLQEMKNALKKDYRLLLSGFGLFEVMEKKDRKGRNPATGDSIVLDGRKVVAFRTAKKLRIALNNKD